MILSNKLSHPNQVINQAAARSLADTLKEYLKVDQDIHKLMNLYEQSYDEIIENQQTMGNIHIPIATEIIRSSTRIAIAITLASATLMENYQTLDMIINANIKVCFYGNDVVDAISDACLKIINHCEDNTEWLLPKLNNYLRGIDEIKDKTTSANTTSSSSSSTNLLKVRHSKRLNFFGIGEIAHHA